MRTLLVLALATSAMTFTMSPSTVSAQSVWDEQPSRGRESRGPSASLYFALGAGGELDVETDAPLGLGDYSPDLDPTLGFGLRIEVPILSILSVGGLFEMGGYKADDVDREADLYFDFDVFAKIGPTLELSQDLDLEIYGIVPFGFSIYRPDADDIDALKGLNFGFGGGAALYLGKFAFFAEIGMRHRRVYDEVRDVDVRIASTQAMMNFGATIVF